MQIHIDSNREWLISVADVRVPRSIRLVHRVRAVSGSFFFFFVQ